MAKHKHHLLHRHADDDPKEDKVEDEPRHEEEHQDKPTEQPAQEEPAHGAAPEPNELKKRLLRQREESATLQPHVIEGEHPELEPAAEGIEPAAAPTNVTYWPVSPPTAAEVPTMRNPPAPNVAQPQVLGTTVLPHPEAVPNRNTWNS